MRHYNFIRTLLAAVPLLFFYYLWQSSIVEQPIVSIEASKPKPSPKPPVVTEPVKPATKPAPAKLEGLPGMMNDTRAELNLAPLNISTSLNLSAKDKCVHMSKHGYWAHSGGGREWYSFIYNRGFSDPVGEILGLDGSGVALYNAWLASGTHKAEIIRPVYRKVGLATCTYNKGAYKGQLLTVVHFSS